MRLVIIIVKFIDFNFFMFVVSNLLFVESPAGVGWSYSNRTSDYTTGDEKTGKVPSFCDLRNGLSFPVLILFSQFAVNWSQRHACISDAMVREVSRVQIPWFVSHRRKLCRSICLVYFVKFINIFFSECTTLLGHYIPQLATVLLKHNKYSTDFKFKIKAVAVRILLLSAMQLIFFL